MTPDRSCTNGAASSTDNPIVSTDGGTPTDAPTVTVSRLVTRRGARIVVSAPEFDQSISLDAVALESLTGQDDAADPIASLGIDSPETDVQPTLSMDSDPVRIVNEYAEVVLSQTDSGLLIESPPTAHEVELSARDVFELAFLENNYAFTALLEEPVTLEEDIAAMPSAFD